MNDLMTIIPLTLYFFSYNLYEVLKEEACYKNFYEFNK